MLPSLKRTFLVTLIVMITGFNMPLGQPIASSRPTSASPPIAWAQDEDGGDPSTTAPSDDANPADLSQPGNSPPPAVAASSTCAPPGSKYGDDRSAWVCPPPENMPPLNPQFRPEVIWGREFNQPFCAYGADWDVNINQAVALAPDGAAPEGIAQRLFSVYFGSALQLGDRGDFSVLYSPFAPVHWYNYLSARDSENQFIKWRIPDKNNIPVFISFGRLEDSQKLPLRAGNYYMGGYSNSNGKEVRKWNLNCRVGNPNQSYPNISPQLGPPIPKEV